jgi:membrane protein required for colicin V production
MAIDIICLIFLAYGFWIGYSKGIISTVLSLASYIFGVLAAMKFGPIMGDMIFGWAPVLTSVGAFVLGVIAVFVMTLVLFRIVAKGLTSFMENININFINQILGGVLSGLFFTFIFSGLVFFGDQSRIVTDDLRTSSITYTPLAQIRIAVWEQGKDLYPVFRDFYDKSVNAMDRLRDNVDKGESDSIFDLEE